MKMKTFVPSLYSILYSEVSSDQEFYDRGNKNI